MEKTESKLSKYELVSEAPKIIKVPGFLSGDFGRDFSEEYQGRMKTDFGNANVLNVLKDGKGSNPYAVVLANQILRQVGLRTATPADIERILRQKSLDLSGVYVDTGLVLRSEDEPNEYLAKDLIRQLGEQKLPVMIPLVGLDLRVDSNAPNGLAFNVREDAEIVYDEILNSECGNFDSDDVDEKTGLPQKLKGGDRYFYTRNSGLSRLYLGGYSDLGSIYWYLADSNVYGRVVITDAEGVASKK